MPPWMKVLSPQFITCSPARSWPRRSEIELPPGVSVQKLEPVASPIVGQIRQRGSGSLFTFELEVVETRGPNESADVLIGEVDIGGGLDSVAGDALCRNSGSRRPR